MTTPMTPWEEQWMADELAKRDRWERYIGHVLAKRAGPKRKLTAEDIDTLGVLLRARAATDNQMPLGAFERKALRELLEEYDAPEAKAIKRYLEEPLSASEVKEIEDGLRDRRRRGYK